MSDFVRCHVVRDFNEMNDPRNVVGELVIDAEVAEHMMAHVIRDGRYEMQLSMLAGDRLKLVAVRIVPAEEVRRG